MQLKESDFPILDNHIHLQERGDNVKAVKKFEKAGGTHLVLSHLPYHDLREWDEKGYEPIYERTVDLAERTMEETSVEIFVSVGPYPVDLVELKDKVGLDKGEEILREGLELAVEYIEEGKAVALGEIGRPHFDVSDEVLEASNRIMKYGMELAADGDFPVVLHTESTTPEVCEEISKMADEVGLSREKIVKHYSPPLVKEEENHGLFPSILANENNIREAISKGNRFLLETDYLDDPNRPGAVLGIKNVPKKTIQLYEKDVLKEKDLWKIHKENPEEVYGVEIEL
ncbi:MAG: TatD family hydrolase [Candidatus Thermoplasmatota archaeon]|nr:TatD family hydrolase [Candidatus Thermoplasmatota archaeon]